MKKIKYLLGLFIVGLCLSINQSFGSTLSYSYCIYNDVTYPCFSLNVSNDNNGILSYGPLYIGNQLGSVNYVSSIGTNRNRTSSTAFSSPWFQYFSGGFYFGLFSSIEFTSPFWYSYYTGGTPGSSSPSPRFGSRNSVVDLDTLNYFGFGNINSNAHLFSYRYIGSDIHTGFNLLSYFDSLFSYSGNNLSNVFFGGNVGFSSVVKSSSESVSFKFFSILDDGLTLDSNFGLDSFESVYEDILVVPLRDYDNSSFDGSYTLVLKSLDDSIIYNLYDCFSNKTSVLSTCSVISKGYISDYSDFVNLTNFSYLNSSTSSLAAIYSRFSELFYNTGGGFRYVNFIISYSDNNTYFSNSNKSSLYNYRYKDFDFIVDNSVEDILGLSSNIDSVFNNTVPFSSLYYQCLGPSYNTSDGLPPAFCLNPDGTLIDVNNYKDCYFELSASGDLIEQMFCSVGDYDQEMAWIGEGSGGYYTACLGSGCGVTFSFGPDYLSFDNNFYLSIGLVEDMITNITGWVGKCPFPYVDFQLGKNSDFLKYLKTLGFKYDPFVFVNCVVAGFVEGRTLVPDILGINFLDEPLIHGDTSQHRLLFTFFDFLLIIGLFGLVTFLKKVF